MYLNPLVVLIGDVVVKESCSHLQLTVTATICNHSCARAKDRTGVDWHYPCSKPQWQCYEQVEMAIAVAVATSIAAAMLSTRFAHGATVASTRAHTVAYHEAFVHICRNIFGHCYHKTRVCSVEQTPARLEISQWQP